MIGGDKENNYGSRGSLKKERDSKSKREIEKEDRGTDKKNGHYTAHRAVVRSVSSY